MNWQQFEAIERSFEPIAGVKFYYLDGALEIMPISPEHKDFKATLRRLLEAYLEEANVQLYSQGGPSLGNQELGTRSEPDEFYNPDRRKPYPDLMVEVVITSGGIDIHHLS